MSTFKDVLETTINMVESAVDLYSNITIDTTPPFNGICMGNSTGYPIDTHFNKGMILSQNIMVNAKHIDKELAFDTVSNIHAYLTKLKDYPITDDFQIINIATVTTPMLIDIEDNKSYIIGSTISVDYYFK